MEYRILEIIWSWYIIWLNLRKYEIIKKIKFKNNNSLFEINLKFLNLILY